MASQKKQNDDANINKINDLVTENYTKLSDEFARSQQHQVKIRF